MLESNTKNREKCALEISQDVNSFLWIQAKTASLLAKQVFSNFGFKTYQIRNGEVDFSNPLNSHVHAACLFRNHEHYNFIATVRNPYTRNFSEFIFNPQLKTKDDFKNFLEKKFQNEEIHSFHKNWDRFPDYIIRAENPFEDYLKIPFIEKSEFAKSGELEKLVKSVPNKSRRNFNIKDYFDKDVADIIYYNTCKYFEMFGYEKNSWKEWKN